MDEFYKAYRAVLIEHGHSDRLAALDAHINHRGTVESISALLEDSGFQVVEVVTDSFRMKFADGSALLRHHLIRRGFLQDWKSVAPSGAPKEIFEKIERKLNDTAKQLGELVLTVPMACVVAQKAPIDRLASDRT
jgi:hypothetical protein